MAKQRRPSAHAAASKTVARTKRPTAAAAAKRRAASARARRSTPAPVAKVSVGYAKAVTLYEKGLKALHRHQYETATTAFRQLLELYPDEQELHERARLYLAVCERETGPQARPLRGAGERILAATVALNRRDVDEALAILRGAAAAASSHDYVQYMLALAYAQRGDAEAACRHLTKAIALDPKHRLQARHERDFDPIRRSQSFLDAIATR